MLRLQRPPSLAGGLPRGQPARASAAPLPARRARGVVAVAAAAAAAPSPSSGGGASSSGGGGKPKAARPVQPGSNYPAGEFCSNCGLCDTPYIRYVRDSCAFLGDGMARLERMEQRVHGRGRRWGAAAVPAADQKNTTSTASASDSGDSINDSLSSLPPLPKGYDELRFGVTRRVLFGRRAPGLAGAQWTGVVTSIACAMLEQGLVDAVVVTQPERLPEDDQEGGEAGDGYDGGGGGKGGDPFAPVPVVARSVADVVRARGVRPTLAPTLAALSAVEACLGMEASAGDEGGAGGGGGAAEGAENDSGGGGGGSGGGAPAGGGKKQKPIRRLLFCGVGCQVQALRAIEPHLKAAGLEELYVLGTNCVDNGRRDGLGKFLHAAERALAPAADGAAASGGAAAAAAAAGRPPPGKGPIRHYEFMADLNVHLMRAPPPAAAAGAAAAGAAGAGAGAKNERAAASPAAAAPPPPPPELLPYFCLPADELNDVIAPSCYSCFDYANGLADLTVGYMGVPYRAGVPMTAHPQYLTVRNERGEAMLRALPWAAAAADGGGGDGAAAASAAQAAAQAGGGPAVGGAVFVASAPESRGDRRAWVLSTLQSDDAAKLGEGPAKPAPLFVGRLLAWLLSFFTPKGLEFAAYSVDYHTLRNWIYVQRHMGGAGGSKGAAAGGEGGEGGGEGGGGAAKTTTNARADRHVPAYAKAIVAEYEASSKGQVSARVPLRPKPEAYARPGFVWGPGAPVPKQREVAVRVGGE